MANSPEYPDLPWVPPKSFSSGRAAGQPTVIVMHTTEGSYHGTSAEDGAAYDARRTDGTSTHYFMDSNSTIQCVRTTDRSHTARASGNKIGIHYELCGRAAFTAAQWANAYGNAMLLRAAKQAARDAKKYGIPVVKLTPAQVKAGQKGFCGHHDITLAFGESTHTDPGPNFPWTTFLAMVRTNMEAGVSQADVIAALKSAEGKKLLAEAAFNTDNVIPAPGAPKAGTNADGTAVNTHWGAASYLQNTYVEAKAAREHAAAAKTITLALQAAVTALSGKDMTDEPAIVAGVLAGLKPEAIAAAIPGEMADKVAQLLAARLAE